MISKTFAICLLAAMVAGQTSAQPAKENGAASPNFPGVVEIVPTSRLQPVEWRYTIEKPADGMDPRDIR